MGRIAGAMFMFSSTLACIIAIIVSSRLSDAFLSENLILAARSNESITHYRMCLDLDCRHF